ncbi:YidC/Oxa1 family membrane protein insertase [Streptomyces netropsis]|uniref:Membrane protein insertase YidC n=1 Tax=Streptomyces netropsis TaxID=55404 RepID=A0A7W7L5X6_STRNE|nr:membrane protein insertase YidC [Streptomyces netropsis]MBB4884084.1 YidC/Oxa1 family membrane protein insertase [Streptomyces netropsis]
MSVFAFLGTLLSHLTDVIDPVFGASATAAAIVLFTLGVRLALHPLARSAARGEGARAELAPELEKLRRKHKNNPERLHKAASEMYAKAGSSPLAGCLPSMVQLPVFYVMYHLFSTGSGGDGLLDHTLLGAPLGSRWADALGDGGVFGQQGLVYLALFALIAAVATWTYTRSRKAPMMNTAAVEQVPGMASMTKILPLLAFGTVVTAAIVPLAAGLYLATTTAWTAAERAYLTPLRTPRTVAKARA